MSTAEPTAEPTAAIATAQQPQERRDRFGNTILDTPGPLGQYRIESARDHRVLRVCGEAATTKHLLWWDYDEGERRMVCRLCWLRRPAPASGQAEQAGQPKQAGQESSDV